MLQNEHTHIIGCAHASRNNNVVVFEKPSKLDLRAMEKNISFIEKYNMCEHVENFLSGLVYTGQNQYEANCSCSDIKAERPGG